MRSNLGKLPYPVIGRVTSVSAGFSTSSAGGGGRGRGGSIPFSFTVDSSPKNESDVSNFEGPSPQPQGHGRGRGQPLPASPVLPTFSSLLNKGKRAPPLGRGRGFAPWKSALPSPRDESGSQSLKPQMDEETESESDSKSEAPARPVLPGEISFNLSGAGRGKPEKVADSPSEKPKVENRHVRVQYQRAEAAASSPREQLSEEDKVKRAMEILTRGDPDGGRSTSAFMGGRGARGRGVGRGRGRGRGRGEDRYVESDDEPVGFGDPADEEKVAKKLGPEVMNKLTEGFEEMSNRVLPSPLDDAYLDAFHTNMLLECEPEYLMEEFGRNPDIDEKPPIPLRDALEKVKPFLMAYEGIQSQEEWEEVIEETMKTVPLMKEIVDYYSGPDRITAKQQQEELETVAKTLPASAPASVKRFTDIALLSLQSNPGWGFDKKCQFMDKLVMEVSKQYK